MTDLVKQARELGGFSPEAELCSLMADEIERLRNAIYDYAEHVLIMEGTDFISSIVDDDLRKLMERICHSDPALGEKE